MHNKKMTDWINILSGSAPGENFELPVLSGSMDPFLSSGEIAVIRKLTIKDIGTLHTGAIIVYREKFRLTAHRMIVRLAFINRIYEKGDKNRFGSFIKYNAVLGVVGTVKKKKNSSRDFFTKEEIRIAKKEARKNMFRVCINAFLIIPRRFKGVLEKK